jgi:hypothetical protein
MQCRCGGETRLSEAVKGKLKARLDFQVCKACGWVTSGELFIKEVSVAEDSGSEALARQLFDCLDETSAAELHALALARRAPTQSKEPEQANLF